MWVLRIAAWVACAIVGSFIGEWLQRRLYPKPAAIIINVVRIRVNQDLPELDNFWADYVRWRWGELQFQFPKMTQGQRTAVIEREVQEANLQ